MTYLSVRTLRRYHESGILEPAHVDSETGYRYYTSDQLPTAQLIRRLRTVDMPLEAIRGVLDAPDIARRDELIAAHLARIERRLEETRDAVTALRLLFAGGSTASEITRTRAPALRALAITGDRPLDDVHDWFRSALDDLHAAVPPPARTGSDGALYFPDFFHAESGRLTVFVPTRSASPPDGRIDALHLPAAELAVARHDGWIGDLDRTYGTLGAYVARHQIGAEGPIRERFLGNPEPDRHLIEVGWPITEAQ